MIEGLELNINLALFILRLGVAVVFLYHGWMKLANAKGMAQAMGWSAVQVLVLGLLEFLAGAALVVGFWMQIAAVVIGIVMMGALYMKIFKWRMPFTALDKTGWEFDLVLLASALAILFSGG